MPRFSYRPPVVEVGLPKYRKHRASGQAVVTLNGRDCYLGPHGTAASKREYDRLVGEWLAAGRQLPLNDDAAGPTIAELSLSYARHVRDYYKGDAPRQHHISRAIRALRLAYGTTPAADFGPLALASLQQGFVREKLSRGTVNSRVGELKRLFKWAVAKQLVPPSVFHGLECVEGLRRGHTEAREPKPIQPVDDAVVEATLPYLPPLLADMLRLQRLTGMRPGEVCTIRPADVDRSQEVWMYRPESHKTSYLGRDRAIPLGPQAQDVLRPYLLRDAEAYCFQPAESETKRHATQRANRKTPVQPSQRNRRKRNQKRPPTTGHYGKDAYRRAVARAVEIANRQRSKAAAEQGTAPDLLPHWHPNQLRHSMATRVRKLFGLEAAQVVLGHSRADITQIYAERDSSLACEVALKIG